MTEKLKERTIIISGSFIASILVMLVGFSLNANRLDSKEIDKRIEERLPILQYEKDKDKAERRINNLEQSVIKSNLKYVESFGAIQTDLSWIRRELDNQRKDKGK
jgi:hypothetical protein